MSAWDDELDRCGVVTVAEAHEIASRFNASHWKNSRPTGGEVARYSIPADPKRDDDLRLRAFIRRAERMEKALRALDEGGYIKEKYGIPTEVVGQFEAALKVTEKTHAEP